MPDLYDNHQLGHAARGEDGPDVEGHIDTAQEARPADPVESVRNQNDEDEGPDVEGHGHFGHAPQHMP